MDKVMIYLLSVNATDVFPCSDFFTLQDTALLISHRHYRHSTGMVSIMAAMHPAVDAPGTAVVAPPPH